MEYFDLDKVKATYFKQKQQGDNGLIFAEEENEEKKSDDDDLDTQNLLSIDEDYEPDDVEYERLSRQKCLVHGYFEDQDDNVHYTASVRGGSVTMPALILETMVDIITNKCLTYFWKACCELMSAACLLDII